MAMSDLPEDGDLRLGPVTLPAGRRIRAARGSGGPVAWATLQPIPDPGSVWAALSAARQETGLVPILLSGLGGDPQDTRRPWDNGEFDAPADVTQLERLDAARVLREMWDGAACEGDDEDWEEDEEDEEMVAMRAPFSRQFPGLAPDEDTSLSRDGIQDVLTSLRPARLGLVPASRPADVLPLIGWSGFAPGTDGTLSLAAVLRSWEERFGARLLDVGFAEIRLLVERPPRTHEAAQRLAAEQFVFCDECTLAGAVGLSDVSSITARLVNTPIWGFWWD
ncbi:MAG: DUF4253 domain-containing protein [Trebonia sp.]